MIRKNKILILTHQLPCLVLINYNCHQNQLPVAYSLTHVKIFYQLIQFCYTCEELSF